MDIVTILLRIIHIFAGIFWVGALWMVLFFVLPAAQTLGNDASKFMNQMLVVQRYPFYASIAAGLTLLAGWTLFFYRYGIVGLQTGAGITFGIGGILGLVGGVLGGVLVGATAGKISVLGGEMAKAGKPPSAEQLTEMAALQARLRMGTLVTAVIVSLAVLCMAVARYV